MKKFAQKVKQETKRAADNTVAAFQDGTVSREVERVGKQIGATAENAGQQVRDVTVKAVNQGKEAIIRAQTADQREEANERQKRCATKIADFKGKLAAKQPQEEDYATDSAALDIVAEGINGLAEKIRSRDQEDHAEYAFKAEITDDPKKDCKRWLGEQAEEEETLNQLCKDIAARLEAVNLKTAQAVEVLPPLALSAAAKAIIAPKRKATTLPSQTPGFNPDALSAAFGNVLGANKTTEDDDFEIVSAGERPKSRLEQG